MKSPHKPIPRVSPKKASKGFQWPKRSAVKKVNPARKRKEFARCYGSKARVQFVKSLPCAFCGIVGHSENAHIENGGAGRKADYTKIIPLCGIHWDASGHLVSGCHYLFDHHALKTPLNLEEAAKYTAEKTENLWIAHSQEKA